MRDEDRGWGPLARGGYIAMLWFTLVIGWHYSNLLPYYLLLLLFLGLGLRPLLRKTGLLDRVSSSLDRLEGARWKKVTRQRRAAIERQARDNKYRYRHRRDPRLPDKW
jgi:hypothetical protein